jgi:hypothetical protein
MGLLAATALRAADILNGLKCVVGAAFALAGLAVPLDGKHVELTPVALTTGTGHLPDKIGPRRK